MCGGFEVARGVGDEGSRACVRCSDHPSLLPRPRAVLVNWLSGVNYFAVSHDFY